MRPRPRRPSAARALSALAYAGAIALLLSPLWRAPDRPAGVPLDRPALAAASRPIGAPVRPAELPRELPGGADATGPVTPTAGGSETTTTGTAGSVAPATSGGGTPTGGGADAGTGTAERTIVGSDG